MKALPSQAGRAAALVLGLAAAGFAQAQTPTSATINFTGSIKDVPCEIDTSATSSTVDLGTNIDIQTLRGGAGKASTPTTFKIVLKGCGAGVAGATLKFSGTTDTTNNKLLAVSGGAEGIGVQLTDQDGTTPIDIGGGGQAAQLTVDEGNNTYNFKANYVSTLKDVKPGTANAVALFALTYK